MPYFQLFLAMKQLYGTKLNLQYFVPLEYGPVKHIFYATNTMNAFHIHHRQSGGISALSDADRQLSFCL